MILDLMTLRPLSPEDEARVRAMERKGRVEPGPVVRRPLPLACERAVVPAARRCRDCGAALVQREGELERHFRERSFCNRGCGSRALVVHAAAPRLAQLEARP